jgi:hypothetical protein
LVVIAAEQYASRLVVPASQRSHPTRWSSHKDHAAKALRKLAGPHLPASLAELERAVKRAHRDYATAERGALETAARERATTGADPAQDVTTIKPSRSTRPKHARTWTPRRTSTPVWGSDHKSVRFNAKR